MEEPRQREHPRNRPKHPSNLGRVNRFLEARSQKNVRVLRAAHLLPQRLGQILRQDLHLVLCFKEGRRTACINTDFKTAV